MLCRGAPPKGHLLYTSIDEALHHEGNRTFLTYRVLTGHLMAHFSEQLKDKDGKQLSRKQVYDRVWRWCDRNDVGLRKPTQSRQNSEDKERKTGTRCWGTLNELARVMKANDVRDEEVANLDETALRIFALSIMTLHWRGDKSVVVDKGLLSKLCLSIVINWYGDGSMSLVVVWTSPHSTRLEWSNHGAVSLPVFE